MFHKFILKMAEILNFKMSENLKAKIEDFPLHI
jgi:hypothetical protein